MEENTSANPEVTEPQAGIMIELISFKLCPFIQRLAIVLMEKNIPFRVNYIDLENPPEWFLKVSPARKVPVLREGNRVLFEPGIIAEYLDEVYPPSLHPHEPYGKAIHRGWIEFATSLMMGTYLMTVAKEQELCERHVNEVKHQLKILNEIKKEGTPLFSGEDFSIVDAAFAPAFQRLELNNEVYMYDFFQDLPNLNAWKKNLLQRKSVVKSVPSDFNSLYNHAVMNSGGYYSTLAE